MKAELAPFPGGEITRATTGRLLINAEGLHPLQHTGWVPPLPTHSDAPAEWVRKVVAVWGSVAEEALAAGEPERAQALIPRAMLALPFGAVSATILTRLLAERLNEEGAQQSFPLRPVVAMGSSFFRGGLRPDTVERFLRACPGMGGMIADAVFQYSYEQPVVERALRALRDGFSGAPHRAVLESFEGEELEEAADRFTLAWMSALPSLLTAARSAIRYVPTDLPGMQLPGELDISLFDHTEQLLDASADSLTTAFSAALHTLGIPPGFAGAGRVLLEISGSRTEEIVLTVFPGLPECIADTLRLVNKEVLEEAAESWKGWDEIQEDYLAAANWVHVRGIDLNEDAASMTHRRATKKAAIAIMNRRSPGEDLQVAARVRRFLG